MEKEKSIMSLRTIDMGILFVLCITLYTDAFKLKSNIKGTFSQVWYGREVLWFGSEKSLNENVSYRIFAKI
jgi:hypothetical protein